MGGGPGPGPAPAPAPAPGPAPAPRPGGATPGGGGGPGGGTPYGGRTPRFRGKKTRAPEWAGAITLPWQAVFLPHEENAGYGARELDLDEALQGRGGVGAWKLDQRPILIFVYDASKRSELAVEDKLEGTTDLLAASRFFNLLRLDVRTIKNRKTARSFHQTPVFLVRDADGTAVGETSGERPQELLAMMKAAIQSHFGCPPGKALAEMAGILERRAFHVRKLRELEGKLVCAGCGKIHDDKKAARREIQDALKELDTQEAALLERRP